MADNASNKTGLAQLAHINDPELLDGTGGLAADDKLGQLEFYRDGVKGKLPENEYDETKDYLTQKNK